MYLNSPFHCLIAVPEAMATCVQVLLQHHRACLLQQWLCCWLRLSPQYTSDRLCLTAEPTAKKFTDGQLRPAADKVAANAKPMADKFNNEQLLPAADKIAQNAKPTADKLTEGQIKPAAQKIQEQAVPRTKDFTEGTLQPGAKRLADNAEPMADKLIEQGVKPLADVRFTCHMHWACLAQERADGHTATS